MGSPKYNYEKDVEGNYLFTPCVATVVGLRMNKEFVDEVPGGNRCGVLLDKSSFYAEQGGQMYDTGFLTKEDDQDVEFAVANVQVHGSYVIHIGTLEGTLKVGDKVKCNIDEAARRTMMSNHTATHVLNYALRQVIGDADQRGSLVTPDKLRFDFTAKEALAKGIRRIIAVTGHEAEKAHQKSAVLETKLANLRNEVEQQKNSQALDIKGVNLLITALTDDVSNSVIPSWKKDMLREEAGKLKKVVVEADKAVKAEKNKAVVAHAVDGCNSKSLNTAIQQVQKNNPKLAAMFFSVD